MSDHDELGEMFGKARQGGFRGRVGGREHSEQTQTDSLQFAGSAGYRPYGYRPKGTDTCELIWYDTMRNEAREGTFWHYKTLMRVGYSETDPAKGGMTLVLYLADVNIMIEGYHLYPLMDRLRSYECARIEQYSPRLHAAISPEQLIEDGETVITSVTTDQGMLFTSQAVRN